MLRFPSRAGRRPLALTLAAITAFTALTACADQADPTNPEAPPPAEGDAAGRGEPGSVPNQTQWADGYLRMWQIITDAYNVYVPGPSYSFNRAARFGGAITVVKPVGTTGRYVTTFPSLSTYLGGRRTVHVSAFYGDSYVYDDTYCKPTNGYLVSDTVEVRCFKASTGAPANAAFSLLVTRNYSDLAFAYAHRETSTNYTPASAGSWNPAGTSSVARSGVGQYRVTFNNLAGRLPSGVSGHVQVNAVGTSNAYCNAYNWGTNGSPSVYVDVRCYATPTGAPVDRRFTVLFLLPSDHLAYALGDQPTATSYSPLASYSSNPAGAPITITRLGVGRYAVDWAYADRKLLNDGNTQVTAYGGNAVCRLQTQLSVTSALVQCFAPNGTPADSRYTVLFGS